jgi:RNA polymerase sigma factor (TIGR02999 family)
MPDVTRILDAIEAGDPRAAAELLPLVYDELRRLAAARMHHEKAGQTLQATALVHEAYARLVGDQRFANRSHFFAAAAEAMRRILVEQARRKQRERHGGGRCRVELRDQEAAIPMPDEQILSLDDALTKLAGIRPQAAKLVHLRFFAGLTLDESAPVIGISSRTARRLWLFARAWLRREMQSPDDPGP